MQILKCRGVAFCHTLIGDGDDSQQILSLIEKLGLQNESNWLGTQPHHIVLEHYRKSHLFVLSCEIAENGDRDGIPTVFIESMAMGVPVVSTNISAIPELIENEVSGILVPPKNPEALADAMVRILGNEALRNRIAANARRKVKKYFDNRKLILDMAGVYKP